jgi:glycogen debranching enzyme
VAITIGAASHSLQPAPAWYRGITYEEDARRGYDSTEDQFGPTLISIPLDVGGEIVVAASLHHHVHDPRELFERERRERVVHATRASRSPLGRASLAAEDFLYRTGGGRLGVQAGYPWFEEWGRDTFVALPVSLCARRAGDVRGVLWRVAVPARWAAPERLGGARARTAPAIPPTLCCGSRAHRFLPARGGAREFA